ncbi:MAG: hypothetical protein H6807_05075 [Planctomycetes bacterium]|nr:hypothetical protein [Planctomycetota bacterium]
MKQSAALAMMVAALAIVALTPWPATPEASARGSVQPAESDPRARSTVSGTATGEIRVRLFDASTGEVISGAAIEATSSLCSVPGQSDAAGKDQLQNLIIDADHPEILVTVAAGGYLPFSRRLSLIGAQEGWYSVLSCPLTALHSGYVTPDEVGAAGGVFNIPDLGTLTIEAGAIPNSAGGVRIRVISLLDFAGFDESRFGFNVKHVYVRAEDVQGAVVPNVIGSGSGSFRLAIEPEENQHDGTTNCPWVWRSYLIDSNRNLVAETAADYEIDTRTVTFTLADGENVLAQGYDHSLASPPDASFSFLVVKTGPSWSQCVSHVPMIAGSTGGASATVALTASDTFSSEVTMATEVSSEIATEVGTEVSQSWGKFQGKVAAKVGGKLSKSTTDGKVTQTGLVDSATGTCLHSTYPWTCLDGYLCVGRIFTRFDLYHVKVGGSGAHETKVADVWLVTGTGVFYDDLSWNVNGDGCMPPGVIPTDPRFTGQNTNGDRPADGVLHSHQTH